MREITKKMNPDDDAFDPAEEYFIQHRNESQDE